MKNSNVESLEPYAPSPALKNALRRRFAGADIDHIEAVYRWSAAHGALVETGMERPKGASFNPRPSRICQLLLQDGAVRGIEIIEAALIAAADGNSSPPEDFSRGVRMAELARVPAQAATNPGAFCAAVCIALDSVRHLHMRADRSQHDATLEIARALLELEAMQPQERKLCELLRHAVKQQGAV